jgi:hypothetical protein
VRCGHYVRCKRFVFMAVCFTRKGYENRVTVCIFVLDYVCCLASGSDRRTKLIENSIGICLINIHLVHTSISEAVAEVSQIFLRDALMM